MVISTTEQSAKVKTGDNPMINFENETLDCGNNERVKMGVFPNGDGTFTAMTYTQSRTFKTESGAAKWLLRQLAD
uniref:DUF1391 domain-containing protein n=1 Tax=Serratia proteamaculans (strain 568) TaxID=399741 RepID=A8GLQ0_SERP5